MRYEVMQQAALRGRSKFVAHAVQKVHYAASLALHGNGVEVGSKYQLPGYPIGKTEGSCVAVG